MIALVLSVVAVAYNNAVNHWKPFQGWAYVPLNLVLAAIVALGSGLSVDQLGLRGELSDAAIGLLPVGLVGVLMFGVAASRFRHLIADARVEGRHGSRLAYYTLVRIPFGTAVAEEVIFRGALFGAWLQTGVSTLWATLFASIAFGLWHVSPTIVGLRMNDPDAGAAKVVGAVLGAILFTGVAGALLTWLRVWSGGLIAPIVAHAGVNSVSALAAARARFR